MTQIDEGPSGPVPQGAWRKSRHSNPRGACVEVAELRGGGIAVRNSRDPEGPVLIYTRDEVAAFVLGAKDGEFDDLTVGSGLSA